MDETTRDFVADRDKKHSISRSVDREELSSSVKSCIEMIIFTAFSIFDGGPYKL